MPGGGEHPPPRLAGGDVQSWLSPKGPPSPLWQLEEASAPPCSAQPHSLGSEPGQGRGGGVCYRIWGDGVSLPKLSKLKQAVLSGPSPCSSRSQNSRANALPSRVAGCRGGHSCLRSPGFSRTRGSGKFGRHKPLHPPLTHQSPHSPAWSEKDQRHLLFCMLVLAGDRRIPLGLNMGLC